MKKKKIVIALGHDALGTTLPEQKEATKRTAKAVADFIREDYQVVITHSNGPQVGMIHTAMNEFCRLYPEYTATPMSVCSAMSQGYIGYDLQNAIRAELLNRGIYKTVSTILTPVSYTHRDALIRILKEPKNALTRQYEKLFELDGVKLALDADEMCIRDSLWNRKRQIQSLMPGERPVCIIRTRAGRHFRQWVTGCVFRQTGARCV